MVKIPAYNMRVLSDDHGEYCQLSIKSKGIIYYVNVDREDYEEIRKEFWQILYDHGKPKYVSRNCRDKSGKRKRELLHRRIMKVNAKKHLDHIDHNGFNCRRYNLRIATHAENIRNRVKKEGVTSKYKGVCWKKRDKKWTAQITYNGLRIHIGVFDREIINGEDEGEKRAARRYDQSAIKYFGAFANLNFPEERNIVSSVKGDYYRMSYLFNKQETKQIESEIMGMEKLLEKDITEVLEAMPLQKLMDLCHYYGCGVSKIASEIRQGILSR